MSRFTVAEWEALTGQASGSVGGISVSHSEILNLDRDVKNLDGDINGSDLGKAGVNANIVQFRDWKKSKWDPWFKNHLTFFSQTGTSVSVEFEVLKSEYVEFRRQFIAAGGKTSAPEQDTSSGPLGNVIDSASSTVASIAKPALILTAVALGAYLLIPLLSNMPKRSPKEEPSS